MSTPGNQLLKFLGDGLCLIVEPSSSFSASLQTCLKEMGIPPSQILLTRKFDEAKRLVGEKKPRLLITEYEIEKSFGLALIELQGEQRTEMERISVIVTKNNSDSTVAEAAEEDVDLFILKPFSAQTFKKKLDVVIQRKIAPSSYSQRVLQGKRFLESKEFDAAIHEFSNAKPLDEKPTLAHFYAGRTHHARGERALALAEFQACRKFQPLHYKCLIGEFEVLIEEKRYKEAYELVPLIRDNYPITSHRLGQIFIAAVMTHNFKDLPPLFDLFLSLEQRPAQLVKITSLALLTGARMALKENDLAKAMVCFEMGVMATGRSLDFIETAVTDLIKHAALAEAQTILAKVSKSDVGTPRYNQLAFRIDELTLGKDQLIEKGRKLVLAGEGSPEIFQSLVRLMASEGKIVMAETVIHSAIAIYPELRDPLYKILEASQSAKR